MLLVLVLFLGAGFGGSFVGGVIYGQTLAENAEDELSPRLGAAGQFGGGGPAAAGGQRGLGRQGQGQGGGFAGAQGGGNQGGNQGGGLAAARQGAGAGAAGLAGARNQGGPPAVRQDNGSGSAPEAQAGGQQVGDGPPGNRQRRGEAGDGQDSQPASSSQEVQGQSSTVAAEVGPGETGGAAETQAAADPTGAPGRGGAVGTVKTLDENLLTVASLRGDLAVVLSEETTIYRVTEADTESLTENVSVRVNGARNPEGEIAAQAVIILPEGAANLFGVGATTGGRQRGGRQ